MAHSGHVASRREPPRRRAVPAADCVRTGRNVSWPSQPVGHAAVTRTVIGCSSIRHRLRGRRTRRPDDHPIAPPDDMAHRISHRCCEFKRLAHPDERASITRTGGTTRRPQGPEGEGVALSILEAAGPIGAGRLPASEVTTPSIRLHPWAVVLACLWRGVPATHGPFRPPLHQSYSVTIRPHLASSDQL